MCYILEKKKAEYLPITQNTNNHLICYLAFRCDVTITYDEDIDDLFVTLRVCLCGAKYV